MSRGKVSGILLERRLGKIHVCNKTRYRLRELKKILNN